MSDAETDTDAETLADIICSTPSSQETCLTTNIASGLTVGHLRTLESTGYLQNEMCDGLPNAERLVDFLADHPLFEATANVYDADTLNGRAFVSTVEYRPSDAASDLSDAAEMEMRREFLLAFHDADRIRVTDDAWRVEYDFQV